MNARRKVPNKTNQLIYKGTLKNKKKNNITKEVQDITKSYHGLTSTSFKARHSNHMTSFRDPKYRHSTRLSTHIWELKEDGIQDFVLKFSIEKLAPAYKRETQKYLLCLEEKRFINYVHQIKHSHNLPTLHSLLIFVTRPFRFASEIFFSNTSLALSSSSFTYLKRQQ